jgi:F-type H+-transporting ATPase subunit alpha
VEEQVAVIFAGTRGYLDKIEVGRVGKFEHELLSELRSSGSGILEAIRTDREIKKETEKKLEGLLAEFVKRFVA